MNSTHAADATSLRFPDHLAAIDMGSNRFRLEIGQPGGERYQQVEYLKETVCLGAGLDADSCLTEEAMQRGLACLERFSRRLEGYAPSQVRAVATQTLRDARNRDDFLARAQAVLGYPIEVIPGREEARLIFAGVARLQPSPKRRLVIDVGGRSTEMIIGQARTPLRAESFRVGSVSLSLRYFGDGRFTEAAFRAAQVAAGAELEEALVPFAPQHWSEALGSSGTADAVSQLLVASGITDGTITPEALRWCMEQCLRAGRIDALELPGLQGDRRVVIAGGLSILYTLATHFGIGTLQPARGALRHGVIFDLQERLSADAGRDSQGQPDARDESVAEMQRRFGADPLQARRVAALATRFGESVQPGGTGKSAARELAWVCALHEIGMMVSHHDHHRHSAYLVTHMDAAGFSESQQRRLADLVLAQRGGLRKVEVQLLQDGFAWQALCLRLAIIVCHARDDVDARGLQLQRDGLHAVLTVPSDWVQTHPRTLFLLQEEMAAWEGGPLRLVMRH